MELTEAQRELVAAGGPAVMGRVVDLKGFSTLAVDELVLVDEGGSVRGDLLGRPGADVLGEAARRILGSDGPAMETVGIEIHGSKIEELGLSCGGRADVLLQPVSCLPEEFWSALAGRAPVALITVVAGPGAGPDALAVARNGQVWGALSAEIQPEDMTDLIGSAESLLREGRTGRRRVPTPSGEALVEAWVPDPRVVVVGSGDIVASIEAQAGLLGWEVRATDGPGAAGALDEMLTWAGATGALVVCSHDPHVDAPALARGLLGGTPYVGAMGSRGTQSRRLERLKADGVAEELIGRIHRPVGLDLGGRRAPEVALSIVAEILACHCGRSGVPLKETTGPIHG
jgi:xanthine dehydrogenase accessory factor